MTKNLRLRIAAAVYGVVLALLCVQAGFSLREFEKAMTLEEDSALRQELEELAQAVEKGGDLQSHLDEELLGRSKWDEVFIEIRDRQGRIVSRTPNLEDRKLPRTGPGEFQEGVWIREEIHPFSRKQHRRVRIAETKIGPYDVQMAASLKRQQHSHWVLRWKLTIALLIISTAGAVAAYLVAARGLGPLRRLVARAEQLSTLSEGELPRTGSRDEVDSAARVLNDLLLRMRNDVEHMRGLTANVAHALSTPLTAIRGHLELLLGRHDGPESDILLEVLEEVEGLSRLVHRLLLLEELELHGYASLNIETIDLAQLVATVVDLLQVLADEGGIELRCDARSVIVRGDTVQLREVLVNLLDNALRETPRGGRVEVEVRGGAENVQLTVRDTGPGLTPEELEHAFDRFYSGEHRKRTGAGLGLAIARAIARAHGGDLRASSAGGAEFVLELPLSLSD